LRNRLFVAHPEESPEPDQSNGEIGHPASVWHSKWRANVERAREMKAENKRAQAEVEAQCQVQHTLIEESQPAGIVGEAVGHAAEVDPHHAFDIREEEDPDQHVEWQLELGGGEVELSPQQPVVVAEINSAQGIEAGQVELPRKSPTDGVAQRRSEHHPRAGEEREKMLRVQPEVPKSKAVEGLHVGHGVEQKRTAGDCMAGSIIANGVIAQARRELALKSGAAVGLIPGGKEIAYSVELTERQKVARVGKEKIAGAPEGEIRLEIHEAVERIPHASQCAIEAL
jgi:hypothetical protein